MSWLKLVLGVFGCLGIALQYFLSPRGLAIMAAMIEQQYYMSIVSMPLTAGGSCTLHQ